MGLDTTHNAWHGPYSSFNKFRYMLAAKIGIDLDEYIGYGRKGTKDLESIEHDIMPLLNHSDCDGILTPNECLLVAQGLFQILATKVAVDELIRADIIQFMDGCLDAYRKRENLEFQ